MKAKCLVLTCPKTVRRLLLARNILLSGILNQVRVFDMANDVMNGLRDRN